MASDGVTVVLGSQWGDEGKGKLVDLISQQMDVVARCAGGNNAGHTIVVGDKKLHFHLCPSGLLSDSTTSIIGNGVVVHLPSLLSELDELESKGVNWKGRLFLSDRAHIVFDFHQKIDGLKESERGKDSLGTTKKGIGPTYSSKASRSGLRVADLFHWEAFEAKYRVNLENKRKRFGNFELDGEAELQKIKSLIPRIEPMVIDTIPYMHDAVAAKKRVLVEGANAVMLDIDFGTYPFVTSSSASVGGACTGLGLPPSTVKSVIGVVKAYTTRVGDGPFPTEQLNSIGEYLQTKGFEFGTTTGRKRRCGWLDIAVLRYSHMINGYTSLNITKLDVLDDLAEIKIAVDYKLDGKVVRGFPADLNKLAQVEVVYETLPGWQTSICDIRSFDKLPVNAQKYIRRIEELLGVPVQWIGVGAARDAMIQLF